MKKTRNGFKKLLSNIQMNALSRDKNGDFTVIKSSTNRKRFESSGNWWGSNPNSKRWNPSKIYITEQDLMEVWKEQNELCYWFNIPLDFNLLFSDYVNYYPKHPLAPSVDKKNDDGDYVKDNIVICCRFANFGRNIYPFDKFHDVVETIKGNVKVNNIMEYL